MRYTFSLSRGGAFAVVTGAAAGTLLVFAAGLLVGASAAAPDAHAAALLPADSASVAIAGSAEDEAEPLGEMGMEDEELPAFDDCRKPEPAATSWSEWRGTGGQLAPLRAVDLPADHTGGPDPYAPDDADGRTMGTFSDDGRALALMHRIAARGVESYIDARLDADGVPVFRVRTGSPEEAP